MKSIVLIAALAALMNIPTASVAVAGGNSHGQQCDPGFHWGGPKVGCVGETLTDRGDIAAFDDHNADCKPGDTRVVWKDGVMPNGRHVKWKLEQKCTAD